MPEEPSASRRPTAQPKWRHYKIATLTEGAGVDICEGWGATLADAVETAAQDIACDPCDTRFDDRLIIRAGRVVAVVQPPAEDGGELRVFRIVRSG